MKETIMPFYVYIVTNKPNGTLYTGVTNNLSRRIHEHREGKAESFTKKYALKILVYIEEYTTINEAIHREKCIKTWKRAWKVKRILEQNPQWNDLYETIL